MCIFGMNGRTNMESLGRYTVPNGVLFGPDGSTIDQIEALVEGIRTNPTAAGTSSVLGMWPR